MDPDEKFIRYYKRNSEKIKCECGCVLRRVSFSTHLKSMKHRECLEIKQKMI